MTVEYWGPLWATSAFDFEHTNGILSKLIHSGKNQAKELTNNIKILQGVQVLKNKLKFEQERLTADYKVIGNPCKYNFNENEQKCFENYQPDKYTIYGKIQINREIFTSIIYETRRGSRDSNAVRSSNSYVSFLDNNKKQAYGRIKAYVVRDRNIECLINLFQIDHANAFYHKKKASRCKKCVPI